MGVIASAGSLLVSPSSSSGIDAWASTYRPSREAAECACEGAFEFGEIGIGETVSVKTFLASDVANIVLCAGTTAWASWNGIVRQNCAAPAPKEKNSLGQSLPATARAFVEAEFLVADGPHARNFEEPNAWNPGAEGCEAAGR